jgi:hypothetical protein
LLAARASTFPPPAFHSRGGDGSIERFTTACGERSQQRLENLGVTAVSDVELLAMVLQENGTSTEDALKSMKARV